MAVTIEDVRRVAELARLQFSPQEQEQLTAELNRILQYIETLDELDTQDVAPTSHVVPISNAFRKDEAEEFPDRERLLSQAPDMKDGYFRVPKIID